MANYTQYIPQTNSTTYPVSISNCFTALTTDVTALETGKVDLISLLSQTMESELIIKDNSLILNRDGVLFDWVRPSGGSATEAKLRVFDDVALESEFGWNYATSTWFFDNALTISTGNLTLTTGNFIVGTDIVAVRDAALTNGNLVSADASGRITTTSEIVAANIVERSGTLVSGNIAVATTNNDIQTTGIVATNIATLSGAQTITGNKTLSGANTISGVNTFTAIPAFNGGTSGVSAPFTVDSTEVVTNLNANYVGGQPSTYFAPIGSPTFTGVPRATTPTAGDDSTRLATTAFVTNADAFRGCLVQQTTTSQNVATQTETAIRFGTAVGGGQEVYDTDTIHDLITNDSRLIVPFGVNYIKVAGQIEYDNSIADNTMVILKIHKNGLAFAGIPEVHIRSISYLSDNKYPSLQITSPTVPVIAGDYFELIVEHKDTGSSFINGGGGKVWFSMEIING